ncbi:tail fiber protein [Escherichia coli]|uniref:tail fiber protein n=1 Tax=Escherichia coli TaxID=562 RepID=UPI003F411E8F
MNDVTVVTSVTYPSPESLALVADVQYHEPYLSAALNRKFRGIVDPGFYAGFLPKPGGGMNLLITSVDGDKTAGAASVDIGEFYQVTIQHRKDISLALNAGKKYAIVLKGRYLLGEDTYQVNTASHIHAAEFVARTYTDSYQLGDGELLVCTVNIPAGVSTITQEMIDTSERINRTIGIDISDSVTSTRSDVAASSLAVKKAYDLAKSKYTAQDASTTQKGLVQLSSATNSTSEVLAATPKAVKAAYDLANGKYTAQDATTTQKGIVQLSSDTNSTSETLAATPKAVKAAYDLAAGKAPSSHTHPWNQITGVPTASLTAKGITQLSSATNSTSEVLAATPKAVKSVKDLADTKAPIESPSLTGTPTAPTAAQGTNSTQIANTAFVKAAITALINGAPGTLDTLKEIAAAINNDPNFSTTINNALALKAPLASPALTGVPTAPTAAQGTNNTQIATTAYVRAAISALVGSSPEALDTLNELAAALGNDPNFATTMTNALAGKQPLDATLTALAALATGANKLPYFTGKDTVAQTDLTSVGRDILAKTSTLAVIQYLGLRELGTSGEKIPLLSTANTWSARQTFNGGITGALTGNADTATKLKTARTIGGVAFDGSANINLPGVNTTGNQNTTGNAATATKLATARNINGVKFDGSGDVNINTLVSRGRVTALSGSTQGTAGIQMYEAYNNSYPTTYGNVLHMKGASAAGEGELLIGWSGTSGAHAPVFIRSRRDNTDAAWSAWAQVYTSRDSIPGVNATGNQNTTGNAATATKLQTARTIGGVSFDGTANINLPGVNVAGNQNTSGNAATATKLQTARTINGVSFDGSKNIELTPRSIGSINSATMSFSGGAGWFKLATVTMPQASSVVYISLIGGAGYNVGSPQQAGISELVLRAGNGNPKGITGALWRRTSVGFTNFAWVNTSGDTYDIYVEIGNYATGVNIQWDYTKDATVQIHTSPTYTANKPTGLTDGTVYVIYSSHIKPTATDVGALPITGGNLNGGLTATGEIISKSANGLRIAYGNYGFFIRNDGSNTYFMLTDSGNSLGTYNSLRPLIINNANGAVTIGNGLNVTGGINGSLNGNAATATKLQTARTIGGVSFDGSANINLPGVNIAGNQNTTGNAATATKLQTARTINGVSFDGSKNIELTAEDLNLQEFINKANNAVQRSGDILSGGLTFENDSILAWIRNTDWAKIGFKNDADSDTDSYMWFETGDNGNEYFKWRSRQSTTTKDLMTLKWDALNILVNAVINGSLGVGTTNALGGSSIVLGDNDTGFKQNGDGILDVYANSQRVFRFQNGVAIAFKNIQAGDSKKFSLSSSNTSTKNATFNLWGASTRPVVAELGDEAGWHFYSQRNTDNSVIFSVNGQIQPNNWGNFDSRYVKDVRLGTRVVQLMARGGRYEKAGHAITGLRIIGEVDGDDEAIFRPIQKYINGTWYNVAQV